MGDLEIDSVRRRLQRCPRPSVCQTYFLVLKWSLTSHISYCCRRVLGRPHLHGSPKQSRSSCGLSHLLQFWLPGSPNAEPMMQLPLSASGLSPHVQTHFFSLPTCPPTCSAWQSAVTAANTYCVLLNLPWPQLPAHRTQDTVASTTEVKRHGDGVRLPEQQRAGTRQAESMSEDRSCTPQERDSA